MRQSSDPDDPLAVALAPPPNETAEDRAARLDLEAEAKRVNDEIDERIKQDRIAWKKHKNMFKLLLLGQSESGTPPSSPLCTPCIPSPRSSPRFSHFHSLLLAVE